VARGVGLATTPDGTLMTSTQCMAPGDAVHLRLRDGAAVTRVESVRPIDDPTDRQE